VLYHTDEPLAVIGGEATREAISTNSATAGQGERLVSSDKQRLCTIAVVFGRNFRDRRGRWDSSQVVHVNGLGGVRGQGVANT
jgi:hypothetical protein